MPSYVLRRSIVGPKGLLNAEPQSLGSVDGTLRPGPTDVFMPEMVPRNCTLEKYKKKKIPVFEVSDEIIGYCSPDSTFAVTKRLLDDAKKSIIIGIYDFSSGHVKELVLNALERGVKVKLMLDIDTEKEQKFFDDLNDAGVDGVPAPSCASERVNVFSSSHEKVIVVDGEWSLVQSGNYSDNSIPLNVKDGGDPKHFRTGNRDTGLAIRSKPLAKFFTRILESDMALELNGPQSVRGVVAPASVFLVEKAPTKQPAKLFPSKTFTLKNPLKIEPIVSPDNYMTAIPDKLRAATSSILIQQQYIRGKQPDISELLDAIKQARDEAGKTFDIRIILGKIFSAKDLPKENENLKLLKEKYGLVLGKNIRYVDTSRFVHCHNKMVLVDGKGVLVSSQNWSDSAVSKNREAGIWLEHAGICKYFTDIFESDWKTALKGPAATPAGEIEPEALRKGGFVRVEPADYQEV